MYRRRHGQPDQARKRQHRFALKIIHSEALPLYDEVKALLAAMPELDIERLHKLADQIARKADAEASTS